MKTWVSVKAPAGELEAELNRLCDGGYHIFKIFPVYARSGASEGDELTHFYIAAFNTVELMKKLQGTQVSGVAALMAELAGAGAKAAPGA